MFKLKDIILLILLISLFSCTKKAILQKSIEFEKNSLDTVMDIDSNVYKVVRIGRQVWMAENLKTTRFNDGSPIPEIVISEVFPGQSFLKSSTPVYCWYHNDSITYSKYGALYNSFAVNTGKLAPKGWHVATNYDWCVLDSFINVNYEYPTKAIAAKTDWPLDIGVGAGIIGVDIYKNDSTGFCALPAGYLSYDNWKWKVLGDRTYWWTSTKVITETQDYKSPLLYTNWVWYMGLYFDRLGCDVTSSPGCGLPVRCVKD